LNRPFHQIVKRPQRFTGLSDEAERARKQLGHYRGLAPNILKPLRKEGVESYGPRYARDLISKGSSISDIARMLGVSEDEVKKFLAAKLY
jgi:hypothetical protein